MSEAPVVEEVPATPGETEDVFSQAFAQITAFDAKPAEKPAEKGQKQSETELPAAEGAEKPEEKPIEAAEKPVIPEKPAEKTPDSISDDDLVRRLSGMIRKAEPSPVEVPTAPAEPAKSPYTPDEFTQIEAYVKDFPDVAKAEALIRRSEYQAMTGYIFAEVARELQPLVQTLRTISERTYLGDLQAKVPDYAVTRDQVLGWVEKQPPYLKAAYQHVVKSGTVDEVADLIQRYKTETGTAAPAAPAAAVKAEPELTPAAKKAVAALAPVSSKRSTAVSAEPTDFASAFESFAKEM